MTDDAYQAANHPLTQPHADFARLAQLYQGVRDFQSLASAHGISDVFQDNGGKLLQILLITGLRILEGREGNDAVDAEGNEYELKTVNINNKSPQFTTHHHLNLAILEKYRGVQWVFSMYDNIEPREIYLVSPDNLEQKYFSKWEQKIRENMADPEKPDDLNNPKISLSHVRRHGQSLLEPGRLQRLFEAHGVMFNTGE